MARFDVADPVLGCAQPGGSFLNAQSCRFSGTDKLSGNGKEPNGVFDAYPKASSQLNHRRPEQYGSRSRHLRNEDVGQDAGSVRA
jgi:hypothetical protein